MVDYVTKIKELEEQISKTKYNKATSHAIGLMKAQLARLKDKEVARSAKKGAAEGYQVRKTGDGTVILLGFPSVGKSTLLNGLTNANSEVAAYAFTTLTVIPGLLEYEHAKIQVLDVPGVVEGAATGRGRGREVLACMRAADLGLIILEVQHPGHLAVLRREIADVGIRLDQRPPDVKITKTMRGGIRIGKTVRLSKLDDKTIGAILKEFRINNADVVIRSDITADELIDVIEGNRVYMPSVVVVNKADMVRPEEAERVRRATGADLCISAQRREHLEELKALIFARLRLMRLYLKEPGKDADLEIPLIIFSGATVRDLCRKLHRDFEDKFKFARVWGPSAKFGGQKFQLAHVFKDGDVVELHTT